MKKVLLSITALLVIAGCGEGNGSKYGKGGENACQYVREQIPNQTENIASINVVGEDSVLTDNILAFNQVKFAKAGSDFWKGTLSREDYQKIIDEESQVLYDIKMSWIAPDVAGDSLRKLDKYNSSWRKAYVVKVTMKSGDTKEPRVLMDMDGLTPRLLEMDFIKSLDEYDRKIKQATEDCIFGR